MVTALMDFQSDTFSPRRTQTDSRATLTKGGGIAIDLDHGNLGLSPGTYLIER